MVDLRGTGSRALDRAVERIRRLPDAPPGVVLAISNHGRLDWTADGVTRILDGQFTDDDRARSDSGGRAADRNDGAAAGAAPMGLETRTDLGSVTKIVGTTMALMALVDTGEVTTAVRLGDVLPSTMGAEVSGSTILDLLQHRAGLWEWWPTYLEPGAPLDVVSSLPLRYPPGLDRHYSDLGFMLLGALVTAIAGEPLEQVVSRLVLEPLGLAETTYAAPAPGAGVAASSNGDSIEREMVRTSRPYPVAVDGSRFDGWRTHVLVGEVNDGNAFHSFGSVAGHAGMFSTAGDLLKIGDALLACQAGAGFVSPGTAAEFFRAGENPGQASGFRIWPLGGAHAYGHTGFPGVAMAVVPELRLSVALVMNRLHTLGTPVGTEPIWSDTLEMAAGQGADT